MTDKRRSKPNPKLDELIDILAQAAKNIISPEEIEAQRQSFVRGMTTPCEHGVLDFEQCSECRKDTE